MARHIEAMGAGAGAIAALIAIAHVVTVATCESSALRGREFGFCDAFGVEWGTRVSAGGSAAPALLPRPGPRSIDLAFAGGSVAPRDGCESIRPGRGEPEGVDRPTFPSVAKDEGFSPVTAWTCEAQLSVDSTGPTVWDQ